MITAIEMPVVREVFLTRADNRNSLNRLFEGYVQDFGDAAEQIILTIINELGGMRLTVPTSPKITRPETRDAILSLYHRLCIDFGYASGKTIMQKFILDLGGMRISFPDLEDLQREDRDRRIRLLANKGRGSIELGIMFNLSETQIRRIVNEE